MRISLSSLILLATALAALAGDAPGPELSPPVPVTPVHGDQTKPPVDTIRFAVQVDKGRISLDRVFEVWGPAWYEAMSQMRRGTLAPEACDAKLQKEWERALESVIRDEIFYQEAVRDYENQLEKYIDRIYEQSQRRRRAQQLGPSRRQVARQVKEAERQRIERAVDDMMDRYVRASGGVERLKKVLTARGLNWEEWRERLRRKGFADRHVYRTLSPLVSRQIRPADIREYYKQHQKEFVKPGRVIFRHILLSYEARGGEDAARAAARNIYDAIAAKHLDFAAAARKHSDDAESRERGGLENEISTDVEREAWLSDVREAARKETPGRLGPILLSVRGCHLITLIKAEPGTPIPFREAQRAMRKKIYSKRWETASNKYYKELKEAVRIEILMPRFPQELSWRHLAAVKAEPLVPLGPGARPQIEPRPARPVAPPHAPPTPPTPHE